MPRNRQPRDYRHNRKWVEVLKVPRKPQEITPTERLRRELEETERISMKTVERSEVEGIISQLRNFITDEEGAIAQYKELIELFKRIIVTTGMLEGETRDLERILADETEHRRTLQRVLDTLTLA